MCLLSSAVGWVLEIVGSQWRWKLRSYVFFVPSRTSTGRQTPPGSWFPVPLNVTIWIQSCRLQISKQNNDLKDSILYRFHPRRRDDSGIGEECRKNNRNYLDALCSSVEFFLMENHFLARSQHMSTSHNTARLNSPLVIPSSINLINKRLILSSWV